MWWTGSMNVNVDKSKSILLGGEEGSANEVVVDGLDWSRFQNLNT